VACGGRWPCARAGGLEVCSWNAWSEGLFIVGGSIFGGGRGTIRYKARLRPIHGAGERAKNAAGVRLPSRCFIGYGLDSTWGNEEK